ncbi:MAG: AMP-binding protein, partial [Planctomycetes bacterium]|nr:AMP-binding protein [Planctomycetota bacterium]
LFLEDLPLKRQMAWSFLRRLPAAPHVDPHMTAVILYTSGTTAAPKGVELTYNNLYRNCVDTIHSLKFDSPQKCLNILPPFHVFGLTANVLVPVALGASVYAIPRFTPAAVIRALEREEITVILAIPSMYAALLRSRSATRDTFRSVHLAISGGEPLPDGVRKGFQERFGVTLREGYGMTETSPIISACSMTSYREGSVGRPIRNVEVRIAGQDGDALPPDEDGEIFVRGPTVMKGYYGKPEETRKILSGDGWLATGDVGHLDADGFLTITGRAKEMMIVGGENVFPREIEAVLETHDDVLQVAVIGVRDDLRGEVPVAFVVPRSGARVTEQVLRSHVKRFLAGFKIPRQIIIREDLPVSPTGKILKRCLNDLLPR